MELKIKKLYPNAICPKRATSGSAGMDLYACMEEPVSIEPGECVLIGTGIAIALPTPDFAAFVFARSGLAVKHGLSPANCVGVIDSDYRGEIKVALINHAGEAYTVQPDERIAQMVILPVSLMPAVEVGELDETQRGAGGFGSTGKG